MVLRRGPAKDGGDSPQRTAQQMLSASQLQSLAHGLFPPDEGTVVDWSVAARTIYIYIIIIIIYIRIAPKCYKTRKYRLHAR